MFRYNMMARAWIGTRPSKAADLVGKIGPWLDQSVVFKNARRAFHNIMCHTPSRAASTPCRVWSLLGKEKFSRQTSLSSFPGRGKAFSQNIDVEREDAGLCRSVGEHRRVGKVVVRRAGDGLLQPEYAPPRAIFVGPVCFSGWCLVERCVQPNLQCYSEMAKSRTSFCKPRKSKRLAMVSEQVETMFAGETDGSAFVS